MPSTRLFLSIRLTHELKPDDSYSLSSAKRPLRPPVEVEDLDVVDDVEGAGVAGDEAAALGERDLGLVPPEAGRQVSRSTSSIKREGVVCWVGGGAYSMEFSLT